MSSPSNRFRVRPSFGPISMLHIDYSAKLNNERMADAMHAFNPIQLLLLLFLCVPFEWMIHDMRARMKWIIFGITYYSRVNSIRFQQRRLDHRSTVHSIHEHLSSRQLRCHQFDEYDRRAQENQLPVPVDSVHLLSADTINLCGLKIEKTKKYMEIRNELNEEKWVRDAKLYWLCVDFWNGYSMNSN